MDVVLQMCESLASHSPQPPPSINSLSPPTPPSESHALHQHHSHHHHGHHRTPSSSPNHHTSPSNRLTHARSHETLASGGSASSKPPFFPGSPTSSAGALQPPRPVSRRSSSRGNLSVSFSYETVAPPQPPNSPPRSLRGGRSREPRYSAAPAVPRGTNTE